MLFLCILGPAIQLTTPVRRSSVIRGLLNSFNSLTGPSQYGDADEQGFNLASITDSGDDYDATSR